MGSTARATLPAPIAGLPDNSGTYSVVGMSLYSIVGTPFLSPRKVSEPRPGLATPTRLPLTPFCRPPEPPVPIRLYALDEETVPTISLACGRYRCP